MLLGDISHCYAIFHVVRCYFMLLGDISHCYAIFHVCRRFHFV